MTRVVTPSRLHFGLLNAGDVPDRPRFGGCGLMIDRPGVSVTVEPSADWSADGPNAERALAFARMATAEPQRVTVERCPPEHVGLGVGTALGLAVARAIHPDRSAADLALLVGRGERSGVGLHGFESGGFIVDGGRRAGEAPALVNRYPFPPGWRIAVLVPSVESPWHGARERRAFDRPPAPPDRHDALERLLTSEVVPALTGVNWTWFCQSLREYNRLAGETFAAAQGGTYSGPVQTAVIQAVEALGFAGVGQSSWGPTVFVIAEDDHRAEAAVRLARNVVPDWLLTETTRAAVCGARVE